MPRRALLPLLLSGCATTGGPLLAAEALVFADLPPPTCGSRFEVPGAPVHATDLNGLALPDVCIVTPGPHHVFVIGDWGGILPGIPETIPDLSVKPKPADDRGKSSGQARQFVTGVDDCAQLRVAEQMERRATISAPDYVLNAGDNFYWSGVTAQCGGSPFLHLGTGQWRRVYEDVYAGPGLKGKQWLGVLGNHDYGGFKFTAGWDQSIGYTWGIGIESSTQRWMTPAQYWRVKVWYPDFSVDYFFVDTNVYNAFASDDGDSNHNLCSREHNVISATCGVQGPADLDDCPQWFAKLWHEQVYWLEEHLPRSPAEWQIVVTHFPPEYGREAWEYFSRRHGIDLIIAGHKHLQQVWAPDNEENFLAPTAWVVSGGGGGITSDGTPDPDGLDDQYGFVDLTLAKEEITIEAISHGGQIRSTTHVQPRPKATAKEGKDEWPFLFTSTRTTTFTSTITSTVTTTSTTSTVTTTGTTTTTSTETGTPTETRTTTLTKTTTNTATTTTKTITTKTVTGTTTTRTTTTRTGTTTTRTTTTRTTTTVAPADPNSWRRSAVPKSIAGSGNGASWGLPVMDPWADLPTETFTSSTLTTTTETTTTQTTTRTSTSTVTTTRTSTSTETSSTRTTSSDTSTTVTKTTTRTTTLTTAITTTRTLTTTTIAETEQGLGDTFNPFSK